MAMCTCLWPTDPRGFPALRVAKGCNLYPGTGLAGGLTLLDVSQAPEAWTLPTAEQPLRVAEFDRLFVQAAATVERLSLQEHGSPCRRAPRPRRGRDLVVRETECCSFFTFSVTASGGRIHLDVAVPESQTPVLDSLRWVERVGTHR